MPVMGPGSPRDEVVAETTNEILEFLKEKHHCMKFPGRLPSWQERREELKANLKKVVFDLIQEEYWESF